MYIPAQKHVDMKVKLSINLLSPVLYWNCADRKMSGGKKEINIFILVDLSKMGDKIERIN